jgi:hypothetical protein
LRREVGEREVLGVDEQWAEGVRREAGYREEGELLERVD